MFFTNVKDSPKDAGFTTDWETEDSLDVKIEKIGKKDYLEVLRNPTMKLIYISAICSQFVRWGLVNWVVKILVEPVTNGGYGLSLVVSVAIASSMHWGGAVFSVAMGYISDTLFKGSRWQVILSGFLLSFVALVAMYKFNSNIIDYRYGIQLLVIILFIAGGCIQGLQAPIFNLPGDILGSRLGGTGVGITNGWSYIGASLSGITLGWMLDSYGLMSGILLMAAVSLLGGIIICFVKR